MDVEVRRQNAFRAVELERNYQDSLIRERLPIGEEIALLLKYSHRALDKWTEDIHDIQKDSLIEIRKLAAIAVRCMENHGAPIRIHCDTMTTEAFSSADGEDGADDWR